MPSAPPANDNFANATVVTSVPYVVNGLNTSEATTEANDPVTPCGSTGFPQQSHSVWYRFTPSTTRGYAITTVGTNYDTVLAIWTGTWGSLVNQGCDDDSGVNLTSFLSLTLQGGTTYYIEAMAYGDDAGGSLHLTVAEPPPNDDFDNALTITGLTYGDSQDTTTATTAADDPTFDCEDFFSGQGSHSVWYRVSSPYRRLLTASTLGSPSSDYDTVVGIFTGSRGALTLVACSDDASGGLQSRAQVALQAGIPYSVEVVGLDVYESGHLRFSADLGPICPDFVSPAGVGVEDVTLIASKWSQQQGPPYDYNGDGLVTIYDISQVTPLWGQDCLAVTQPIEATDHPSKKPAG
jgi:hypothetical protein